MSLADLIPRTHDAPEFVDVAQLARWLGVSQETIRRWTADGKLPQPLRPGPRTTRYRIADVVAALESLDKPVPRKRKGVKHG